MKLNLWLYKLERKIQKIAIENLMTIIVVGSLLVFFTDLILQLSGYEVTIQGWLVFDRGLIFSGQVWRLITFIFMCPADGNILLTLLSLYFYWWVGSSLEARLGKARFNLYYLFGVIGSIIAGLILGYIGNTFLNLSLFFAFATMFPDVKVLLFFFIPVKVKWLGIADAVLFLIFFIIGNAFTRAAIIAAIINYLIFFGYQLIYSIKRAYREYKYRKGNGGWQ